MKSKIALLSILTCAFATQAAPVSVTLGVAGGMARGGIKIVKGDPLAKFYKGEKKDDEKSSSAEEAKSYAKNSFGIDISASFLYHKDAFGVGVKAGFILGFGKAGVKEHKINADHADFVEAKKMFSDGELMKTKGEGYDKVNNAAEEMTRLTADQAGAQLTEEEKDEIKKHRIAHHVLHTEKDKEYSLRSGLLNAVYVGPSVSYTHGKFSTNLMVAVAFSSLNVEQKHSAGLHDSLKVEKFSKLFIGYGPKADFSYAINSNFHVFATVAFFGYPEKKFKEETAKAGEAVKNHLEVQHKNVLFFGAGVKFDVVKA